MIKLLHKLVHLWWACSSWLEALAEKNQVVRSIWNLIQSIARLILVVIVAIWRACVHLLTSRGLRDLSRAMRQNLFASAIVLTGFVIIAVVLFKPEEQPPAATAEPKPEDRPKYMIGTLLSLTGKHERRGNEMRRGYELAIEAINTSGGIRINDVPHNLALAIYDDESSPVRAAEVAQLLINFDKPQIMLAPYSSILAQPVVLSAQQHEIPVVVPVASPKGFKENMNNVFMLQSPPQNHLQLAAKLFVDQAEQIKATGITPKKGAKKKKQLFVNGEEPRVGLVIMNDPHSKAVISEVSSILLKADIDDIVTIDAMMPLEEFEEAKQELAKVDALFVSAYADGALRIFETIATEGYNIPFLALTHCDVAYISRREPIASEGALCSLHWQSDAEFEGSPPLASNFSTGYYKAYGSNPSHHAAASAAAIQVIASALKRNELSEIGLISALKLTNLKTFYGPIKFDESGRNAIKPMILSQVTQARYIPVAPRAIAKQEVNYSRPKLATSK